MRVRKSNHRRGAAVVEFAFLLPVLMFLAVIAADWARLFYYTITIEACARNGAIWQSDEDYRSKSPYTTLQQATMAEAPQLSGTATVTPTAVTDATGAPAWQVKVAMPFKTITKFPGVPNSQTLTRTVQMRKAELLIKAP
jgi:Flp pilus assembly protein TadG